MPTLGDRLAWAYLYYDAQTDDARLTLAVARTAALDFGAVVVNHAAVTGLRRTGRPGHRRGRRRRPTARSRCAARVVVNATGVWADDVRALDEGAAPTPSGRPRASTSPCRGTRCATTSPPSCPCPRTGGRSSSSRGRGPTARSAATARSPTSAPPTPTTTATSTTPSAPPRTSTTCSAPSTARSPNRSTECRRARHVGRAAPPGARRRQRPHGRPVPAPPGLDVPAAAWSPSPAASSPPTARWPRTPSTPPWPPIGDPLPRRAGRSRTRKLRLRGADGLGGGRAPPPPPGRALRRRVRRARRHGRGRSRARRAAGPGSAVPSGSRPCTRPATRWPRRSTTSCPAGRGPGSGRGTPPPRPPTTWPRSSPPSWGGPRTSGRRRSPTTGPRPSASARRRACPTSVVLTGGP